ncbi:Olfactory receptor 52B2-like protein [Aix galericulata]|nr:Olfactory receptor 52B2-like protein [Aix galericulata]
MGKGNAGFQGKLIRCFPCSESHAVGGRRLLTSKAQRAEMRLPSSSEGTWTKEGNPGGPNCPAFRTSRQNMVQKGPTLHASSWWGYRDGEVSHLDLHPGLLDVHRCPPGNTVLLVTIVKEHGRHQPIVRPAAASATVPKTLGALWSLSTCISFNGCLAQMFSIYFVSVTELAVLPVMAFDCYITICDRRSTWPS